MHHIPLIRRRPGFLLLEVLVGMAVFSLFVMAIGYTLLYGQENTIMAGDRVRATQFTQRALEAVRGIRDASFSSVTSGQHGVWLDKTSKKWAFSGSQITASGGYTTRVTVAPLSSDWVRLTAETKWKHGYNRSGSVMIVSELTDWRSTKSIGNWGSISVQGSYTDGATPQFEDIAVFSGAYAFVTAASSDGLYIFDIHTLSSPTRVSGSFSLGVSGYDVVVSGTGLYVSTADNSGELKAYKLSNPGSFSSADLIGTYDLPGSSRARSLAIIGDTLYVGAVASAIGGEDEFYTFRAAPSGTFTLLDSINDDSSTFEMIAVSGTAAYLASSMDTSELRVIDVESGSNITLLGGYNLSDRTVNALAIAVSGTSAIIGTEKLASLEEAVLFDLENGSIPAPPPGPWYHEGSGSVVGIDMDPTRCYAFLSALSNRKALQVFNMRNKSTLAELTTYTSTSGLGRGVLYDLSKDRVYLITDRSFLIFQPGASTGTCP